MLQEIKTKEYKLPLKEFVEHYGIKGEVTHISYYGDNCILDKKENAEPYITIDVDQSKAE